MADIEGIKVLNLSSKKRAIELSKKYNTPLINSKSAKRYLSIDNQSILHSGNNQLENSFTKGKFRTNNIYSSIKSSKFLFYFTFSHLPKNKLPKSGWSIFVF